MVDCYYSIKTNLNMIKTDVIIVGAGPVGLFAVHQLGIKGLNPKLLII